MRANSGARMLCVVSTLFLAASLLFVWGGTAAAAPGDIVRCSTKADGGQSNAMSTYPSISADGRYVAFYSSASNLVPNDTNATKDVFRKDLQTGAIVRCSTKADGSEESGASAFPSISADGRYVAFSSEATLVSGDTNGVQDIFRKDLQTGAILRCSTASGGGQANAASMTSSISADGRYVAFYSSATNLVSGDTNGFTDVFRKDLQTGAIVRCSTTVVWGQLGDPSYNPTISADGRYVAFESDSANLVESDTNGARDVFRKDAQTGAVVRCSTRTDGDQATGGTSSYAAISTDARYVFFESDATNLVDGDTNTSRDIFRKDLQTGTTVRCSTNAGGGQGNSSSYGASPSADSRYVAFWSNASDLVTGDTNGVIDVFRKDLATNAIVRCSTSAGGTQGDKDSNDPCISSDGKYVAFSSDATNLVPGDTNAEPDIFRKELALPVPTITSIDPTEGDVGTEVTITGTNFRVLQMGGYVSFGSAQATDYTSWSDTQIKCKVPAGVWGTVDVTVTTGGGTSNAVSFAVPVTFYFAEGYTGPGFEEWLCLMNDSTEEAFVYVTFMIEGGATQEAQVFVMPSTRVTMFVNEYVGPDKSVSTRITSNQAIVVERPMYFNYKGMWTGGHDVVGATSPQLESYFADGYTGTGFEEWLCLMNPNDSPTTAHITYMFAGETPQTQDVDIGANTRATVFVNDAVGPDKMVSTKITSDHPIVAERPMYFTYQGLGHWNWTGGHDVMGTPSPATAFYFAEGFTGAGFEEWLCIQNPDADAANVHINYMMEGGAVHEEDFQITGNSRLTVSVNTSVGDAKNVSMEVTSDKPIVAERPMYFNYRMAWDGGHSVMGATSPQREFYFAEGYTGAGFEEWLCLQNPNASLTTAHVTYMFPGGTPQTQDVNIGPNTRATVFVNDAVGAGKEVSMKIVCDDPIVAERPMYFNFRGVWTGGHDVMGFTP